MSGEANASPARPATVVLQRFASRVAPRVALPVSGAAARPAPPGRQLHRSRRSFRGLSARFHPLHPPRSPAAVL